VVSHKHPTPRHQTAPATSTASAPPPPTPAQLDTLGHAMMLAGNYTGAIAAMRQVLAQTPGNSLLHAYALFDLGRSLRLSGDPQAAIPVLQQRLRYQDQTGVVRRELALAERAAGLVPAAGPGRHRHPHPGGPGQGGPPGPDGGTGLGT
jgi:tetratricopeptide (TPR) repeat protein